MDGMYGFHSTGEYAPDKPLMSPDSLIVPSDYDVLLGSSGRVPMFGSDELLSAASALSEAASITPEIQPEEDMSTIIKAKIASHPSYPRLLEAYIDCQKVGAPPEIASVLDEILRENDVYKQGTMPTCLGADPELDEFMETYCDMLVKYKSDLSRPFDEATTFLNKIELQLRNLCTDDSVRGAPGGEKYWKLPSSRLAGSAAKDEGTVSSDEDLSGGELELQESQMRSEDRELKDRLLRKFGSHISTLKLEFSKKKKKGKLPREARQTLLDWWNLHNKWPYPTEADKIALAESTGLDQKQINNWFINQRKRHWRPSENMQFAVMDNLSGQFFTDD